MEIKKVRKLIRLLVNESGPHEIQGKTTYAGYAVRLALWVDDRLNQEREVWAPPESGSA